MKEDKKSIQKQVYHAAGAAAHYVDSRLKQGQVTFTLSALVEDTGLSTIAARNQLLRLKGQVVRAAPRQEFFVIVSPEHQLMGAPPAAWWLDAYFQWLGRPYYLALQSAAAEYGSLAQAIQVVQVMTDRPRRPLRLGRIRVEFYVKQDAATTPTQPLANAYAPLQVSTPAATIIDLVRYAPRIGGIARAVETLSPLLAKLRRSDLAQALKAEKEVAALQRLGFILDRLGYATLADLAKARLPQKLNKVLLDSGQEDNGAIRQAAETNRWAIIDNATIGNP